LNAAAAIEPQRLGRGMPEDRLTWHLDNWSEWQRDRHADFGRGAPHRASGGIQSGSSRDFDSMVAEVDLKCAKAVDVVIDDLSPVERAAVFHIHMGAVYRFPRVGLGAEVAYARAREGIRAGLLRRGIE